MNTADPFRLRASGLSDAGCVRTVNEDAYSMSEQQGLFIVSDGMGGQKAGVLASAMTVQALPLQVAAECLARNVNAPATPLMVSEGLMRAIGYVNDILLDKTQGHPDVEGLGATVLVAFYAGEGIMALAHLGDSRAYLMRQGRLERLTSDHTLAEMLFQSKKIDRHQLQRHPARHVLTRHMGKQDCPAADTAMLTLQPGDRLLLCTDGLTGMLKDPEIGAILWETENREAACHLLIDRANKAGGRDNITAVIVDVEEPCRRHGRRSRLVVVRRRVGHSLTIPQNETQRDEKPFLPI